MDRTALVILALVLAFGVVGTLVTGSPIVVLLAVGAVGTTVLMVRDVARNL